MRDFASQEIEPHIREWDAKHEVHREVFERMAELGFLGAPIPAEYGGPGLDYVSLGILCEELERADTAFRVVMSVHVGLNSLTLLQWGTEEQKQRWLVPQAKGEKLATFGLTEPGVGTDAGNLATTARRDGDSYVLNGQKVWISLADIADHFLVFATVDRAKKHKGITAFIVERGMAGLTTGRSTASSASGPATPGEIYFDNVRVPAANRLGEEGEGFTIAMSAIDQGRYTVASGAVGLAQACLDASAALRPRTQDVRRGDRPPPAGQADARQDGRWYRGRPAALPPGGVAQEPRRTEYAGDQPRQVVHDRARGAVRPRRDPDPWRVRLFR